MKEIIKTYIKLHFLSFVVGFKTYINTLMELIARLLGTWAPKKTQGLRLQLHLWHVTGLLFVTAYCSSLASRLTTPDYETSLIRSISP